jgi:hypothetical protein
MYRDGVPKKERRAITNVLYMDGATKSERMSVWQRSK